MSGNWVDAFAAYAGPQKKPVIERGLIEQVTDAAVYENRACARKVALAAEIWDSCIHQNVQVGKFITDAGNYAASEIAKALGCSKTVADTYAEIGMDLRLRLPEIKAAFEAGELDLSRVRAIYRATNSYSADAAHHAQTEILHAARRLSPGPLATEINGIMHRIAPEETAELRKDLSIFTGVRYRDKDMIAVIEADLEAGDAAACWQLITEMAATVCSRDPRTRSSRLAAAYVAIMRGEAYLQCTCEVDEDHPCSANRERPDRRAPLTSVTMDVETLIGLSDLPAYLAGHGLIDAEYARELIGNGDLQVILTEAVSIAEKLGVFDSRRKNDENQGRGQDQHQDLDQNQAQNQDQNQAQNQAQNQDQAQAQAQAQDQHQAAAEGPGTDAVAGDTGIGTGTDTEEHRGRETAGTHLTFHPLGRGRRRRGLNLPKPPHRIRPAFTSIESASTTSPVPGADTPYRGSFTLVAALEKAIAADPSLARALYPDGHGGVSTPSESALRYRPTASLAECVRQRDRTCRHPGCPVPAANCEVDHIIPYLHHDPVRGGWTILTNLHCLCRYHHSLKTMGVWTPVMLAGAVEYWRSTSGTTAVTLPGSTVGAADPAGQSLVPYIPRKRRPARMPGNLETPDSATKPDGISTAGNSRCRTAWCAYPDAQPVEPVTLEIGFGLGASVGVQVGRVYAMNRVDAGDWAPF